MSPLCILLCAVALNASPPEALIDDFEGPPAWKHHPDGGVRLAVRRDAEHVRHGRAALRLTYRDARPHWSNLQRAVTVPPEATAIAVSVRVHSAKSSAAMHFWLFEPDGDGWVAPVMPRGQTLASLGPGWHEIAVPVARFRFQPRGNGRRKFLSANKMLLGCNFADLDATLDHLRFITRKEPGMAALPRTADLRVERGEKGSVAILADDLPATAGAADPRKLAALAREMRYGVTLLKAGDAADPKVLTRKDFDVLVVPCAPAYPHAGRDALLAFLKSGGSLVSIGGYAFDHLLLKAAGGWADTDETLPARDMDKPRPATQALNTRRGRPGDTLRLRPDQIGAFDPSYLLEHVAFAATAPDQDLLTAPVRIEGPLKGYAACALLGSNSPVFPVAHARWTPLVNAYDSLGRLRGAVAAVVRHMRGPFAGSSWALFGVTSRDLFAEPRQGAVLLGAALRAVTGPVFLHGLRTDLACYRPGEQVAAKVLAANHGRAARKLTVRFQVTPIQRLAAPRAPGKAKGQSSPGGPFSVTVTCPAGQAATVEARLGDVDRLPEGDLLRVTARLVDAETAAPLDRMSTAFVRWTPAVVASGPRVGLRNNYLTWNGQPRFLCGSNQTGMMWFSEREDPLTWERDFAQMQAHGLRMLRVLHFSPFASDDPPRWGKDGVLGLRRRPRTLLRQTDAIVQLAQKHGIALCLTLHDWMPVELSDAELDAQRDWNRFWAARYRDVPGILYDVQNEPQVGLSAKPDLARFYNQWLKARHKTWDALRAAWGKAAPRGEPWTLTPEAGSNDWADVKTLDANAFKAATLNRWVRANAEGVKAGDPDALVTVGYLQMLWTADKLLGARHVDFNNMHYHAPVDPFPARFKIIDRRFEGKTFSLGEFGAVESHNARTSGRDGTLPDVSIRRFVTMTHYAFGMGAAFALNWDWKDLDDCVFPWGLVHPCDRVPKPLLPAYRNVSLFLERLEPRYEDPGLCLLVPDSHRLGARLRDVNAALYRAIDALLANHVDFNVANERALSRLPATCRTLIWPIPYCPTDDAFARVLAFVQAGGALYLSGDVSYDPHRRRTRAARLTQLGLEDPGARLPFSKAAAGAPMEVQRSTVGKGKVFYVPRPLELVGGPLAETLRDFLTFAGVRRTAVEPDHPRLHVFTLPLADGAATVAVNRTGSRQDVRLRHAALAVDKDLAGIVVRRANGDIPALGCSGASAAGAPIVTGDAHVLLASLDGRDVRHSTRLALFPITPGRLALHTAADWKSPILDIGELDGPAWRTLATRPLRPANGALPLQIDDALARSILIIREQSASSGLR